MKISIKLLKECGFYRLFGFKNVYQQIEGYPHVLIVLGKKPCINIDGKEYPCRTLKQLIKTLIAVGYDHED